jgi:hypothetical protein
MNDVLTRGLAVGLIFILVPLAIRALTGQPGAQGRARLRYSRAARAMGVVMLLPYVAAIVAVVLQERALRADELRVVATMLVVLPGLGLLLVVELFRVNHDYGARGWNYRSPWSAHRRVDWVEVAAVEWRPALKWLDFVLRDGERRLHVSPMLSGLRPFAQLALERLPKAVLVEPSEGCAALRVMASGHASKLLLDSALPSRIAARLNLRSGCH